VELHRPYNGHFPQLRFGCPLLGGYAPIPWQPNVKDKPASVVARKGDVLVWHADLEPGDAGECRDALQRE
jgi:hypothetical protein